MNNLLESVGVVIIGRNEGDRLKKCIKSVLKHISKIVYVDSGSTDGSVVFAESNGVSVVELDMSIPFSAGRARNEGVKCLTKTYSELEFIQFIDGDCILFDEWFSKACEYIVSNSSCTVVAGHTIELYPDKSIYNRFMLSGMENS